MRIVQVIKDFNKNGMSLVAGKSYVMADDIELQCRSVMPSAFAMSTGIESRYRKYEGQDLNGKKIFFWRTGGIGDLTFLSPVVKYLKYKYPSCFIRVASGAGASLENLPAIDELYTMPFDADLLEGMDFHLMFQGIIESSSEISKVTHAVDMFYSYFKIDGKDVPDEYKRASLVYTPEEMSWLTGECLKIGLDKDDFVIGVQVETSSPLRNYPKEKLRAVVDVLAKEPKTKIVLIGGPQQGPVAEFIKGEHKNIILALSYDVRKSLVLANRYDLIISCDSFMVQVAGALDKPLVGIYGPFPSDVRMRYFPKSVGLDTDVVCAPCFKHDYRGCVRGFPSPCFSVITPELVLQAADYLREKYYHQHFTFMTPILTDPDLSEIEEYFLSANKGLCFFGGYFKHRNMLTVETNAFVGSDFGIDGPFERNASPFVLYMNNLGINGGEIYQNSKTLVRPGGYFAVYKQGCSVEMFTELVKDIGKFGEIVYQKLDQTKKIGTVVGRKK